MLPTGAALVADSRAVRPGDAFFAYPGEQADGRRFIDRAIASGAGAIVIEALGADAIVAVPAAMGGGAVPRREVVGLKRACGPIADVDCAVGDAPCLTAAADHGFVLDEAEVTYWGLCPDCST